jgi:hypothetical protein
MSAYTTTGVCAVVPSGVLCHMGTGVFDVELGQCRLP